MDIWISRKELGELVGRSYRSGPLRLWAKSTFSWRKIDWYGKNCGGKILQFNISGSSELVAKYLASKTNQSCRPKRVKNHIVIKDNSVNDDSMNDNGKEVFRDSHKQAIPKMTDDPVLDKGWLVAQSREKILLIIERYVQKRKNAEKEKSGMEGKNSTTVFVKQALRAFSDNMFAEFSDDHPIIFSAAQAPDTQDLPPSWDMVKTRKTLSLPTYYRWRRAYKESGLRGLLPGVTGNNKGNEKEERETTAGAVGRPVLLSEQCRREILAMLFENPRRKATAIWNYLHMERPESLPSLSPNNELPSYSTVQRFVASMRIKHQNVFDYILSHSKGHGKWKGKHQLAIGRADEKVCWPNDRWEIDTSPADIICSDGTRKKLIALVDVRSRRAIVQLYDTSNAWGIAQTLRAGFMAWGIPHEILRDNGLDYQSRLINQICCELSITTPKLPAYAPEKKPHVERFFRTLTEGLFAELTGYTGNCLATRDAVIIEKYTGDEVQSLINDYIKNIYEEHIHSGIGMRPREAFHVPGWTAKKVSERQIDILLMPVRPATVRKTTIRHNNGCYYAPDLVNYEGQKVEIRIDLSDASKIYCFEPKKSPGGSTLHENDHLHGRSHDINKKPGPVFICVATDAARSGMIPADIKKEQYRQKKALEQMVRANKELNADIAGEYGYDHKKDKDWRMKENLKQAAHRKPLQFHQPPSEQIEFDHFKGIVENTEKIDISGIHLQPEQPEKNAAPARPVLFESVCRRYIWIRQQEREGNFDLLNDDDQEIKAEFEKTELFRQMKSGFDTMDRVLGKKEARG